MQTKLDDYSSMSSSHCNLTSFPPHVFESEIPVSDHQACSLNMYSAMSKTENNCTSMQAVPQSVSCRSIVSCNYHQTISTNDQKVPNTSEICMIDPEENLYDCESKTGFLSEDDEECDKKRMKTCLDDGYDFFIFLCSNIVKICTNVLTSVLSFRN